MCYIVFPIPVKILKLCHCFFNISHKCPKPEVMSYSSRLKYQYYMGNNITSQAHIKASDYFIKASLNNYHFKTIHQMWNYFINTNANTIDRLSKTHPGRLLWEGVVNQRQALNRDVYEKPKDIRIFILDIPIFSS